MRKNNSELHEEVQGRSGEIDPVKKPTRKGKKKITWNEWDPFVRATGEALRQLNKRQPKQSNYDCTTEVAPI
jgi:hypothetical protein